MNQGPQQKLRSFHLFKDPKVCHPERRAKPEVEGSSHRRTAKQRISAKILRLASLAQDDKQVTADTVGRSACGRPPHHEWWGQGRPQGSPLREGPVRTCQTAPSLSPGEGIGFACIWTIFDFNHPEGIPQLALWANITLRQQNIIFPLGNASLSRQGKHHLASPCIWV